MMPRQDARRLRRVTARSAVAMFALSMAFLMCSAVLVVLWVDVPLLSDQQPGIW